MRPCPLVQKKVIYRFLSKKWIPVIANITSGSYEDKLLDLDYYEKIFSHFCQLDIKIPGPSQNNTNKEKKQGQPARKNHQLIL